jgi:hypothetical protein
MEVVTEEPGTSGMPACEREILLTFGIAHETADVQTVENPMSGCSSELICLVARLYYQV